MGNNVVKYGHKVLKKKGLIIEVLFGGFNIADMKTNRNMLYSDRNFNPNFDILQDIREATMDFTYEELASYLQYLSETKAFAERKTVILTTEASLARLSEWFDTFKGVHPVEFKVFDTLEKCVELLDKWNTELEIYNEIETLKKAPCSQCFKEPNAFTGF